MFLHRAVEDETISQYKIQGAKLAQAVIDFVENDFDFQGNQLYEEDPVDSEDEDDIESILKPNRGESLLANLRECLSKGERMDS